MSIGEKIKYFRLKNNMTQYQLAKKMYITRTSLALWENNKLMPNLDNLYMLSKVFKIDINEFFNSKKRRINIEIKPKLNFNFSLININK